MSHEQKKPGAGIWVCVVLMGLVLYVLAAPAIWYVAIDCPVPYSTWAHETAVIYRPLFFLMDHYPELSHVWYLYMDRWP